MNNNQDFLLSIRLNSYNQEKYIAAAMDSIMMQKVDFPVEVVVGDDFSTDRTLDIIRTYKDTEFIKIRILERTAGDAYHVERKERGRLFNYLYTLRACRGKYVALLDGDDYWIDPNKLSSQVKFLEENPDYVMSSHEVYVVRHNAKDSFTSVPKILRDNFRFGSTGEFLQTLKLGLTFNKEFWQRKVRYSSLPRDYHMSFEKMLFKRHFMATSALVIRRSIVDHIPDWWTSLDQGHNSIILILLTGGKNYHFNRFFGVHRLQPSSLSTQKDITLEIRKNFNKTLTFVLTQLRDRVTEPQREAIDRKLLQISKMNG